jgi:alkanesulfonate monooxygenase SsuD/methylene tetrahydromethanopterin reductase-like flavin-dependent oxidoreductase (luciferase family)
VLVKIDLLYEIQLPQPWDRPDEEYQVFHETIEQVVLADRVGFDTAWFVEHHFMTGFAHSSTPEVTLGMLAGLTTDIRLGHGVTLLPWHFTHPVRVAERVATLDILSKGRVEFGTGRSSPRENQGFGMSGDESREMWLEALRIIPRMWTEDPFSYEGKHFSIPERSIVPKPVQKPHPPIWVASTSPDSWEMAGENGIGVLGMTILTGLEELTRRMDGYRKKIVTCTPAGAFVNDRCGLFTIVHCADTNREAYENGGGDAAQWYLDFAAKAFLRLEEMGPKEMAAYQDFQRAMPEIAKIAHGELTMEELDAQDTIVIGDPDHCIQKIERYEEAGFERILCLMQAGRLPHQKVMRSLELFGRHVIPHFKAKQQAAA